MNGDTALNTLQLNDTMSLAGSELYRCDTITYKLSIKPLNAPVPDKDYQHRFQRHKTPIETIDVKELCEKIGLSLKSGREYELQLTTNKPKRRSKITFRVREDKG